MLTPMSTIFPSRQHSRPRRVLIIVENLPVPFDKRVWNEATALARAGYTVTVICPVGKGYEARREVLDGVTIYRHPLPIEADGALGYALIDVSAGYDLGIVEELRRIPHTVRARLVY